MEMNTTINGYATTLYHAEHVPHEEALKRFHAVLCMNPESSYQLEKVGFDGRIRLFINEDTAQRVEVVLNTDHLVVREFGTNLKRDAFDRRVYETAVAFLDTFNIETFFYQSVSIQSRIEPTPDTYDPSFSWQRVFGGVDRLPAILQRNNSQASFRMDFEPTKDHPQRIGLQFRWNQRRPATAMLDATIQYPNSPISKMTLGRLSSALKEAENMVIRKIGRLLPTAPGGAPARQTTVAA